MPDKMPEPENASLHTSFLDIHLRPTTIPNTTHLSVPPSLVNMASSSSSTSDAAHSKDITITITHRGSSYPITISPSSLLTDLQDRIDELTDVPVSHQKLIFKGKKAARQVPDDETVEAAGLKDGVKVMLVGGTRQEVGGMQREEDEARRRERIDRERRAKPQAKVRNSFFAILSYGLTSVCAHSYGQQAHRQRPISTNSIRFARIR